MFAGIFQTMSERKIEIALFIIRATTAIFLGLWATLKFVRPEWTENIFRGFYNLPIVTSDYALYLGIFQLATVACFAIGLWRFWTYGLMMLMSAAGVIGSLKSYVRFDEAGELVLAYTNYPHNLMLTAIPTLGALVALFLLRDMDNLLSVSGKPASTNKN
ncbi:MAG: hypothetical protein AAGA76_04595 [Pseudomonadota bacterium]